MKFNIKLWLPIVVVYTVFFLWYTNLSGPLTDQEIETYKKIFEESNSDRRDSEQWKTAFKFMSEDDGKDFYMVNFLDRNESPRTCLLYTSPSPRDRTRSRMPSSA